MTPERKLKAYVWHNDYDNGTCVIVWAETAGQAKRMVADESCLQFTEVRLHRLPWADNYRSMDEKGEKQQELYKLLCQVMELIPQVDMSHKWPAWERRIDDTTYLTPMLDRLKAELKKRKEQQNGKTNRKN